MSYYNSELPYSDELFHHGIKGQKWGIRRFQNPDGTLTALGKVHYGVMKAAKKTAKTVARTAKRAALKFEAKHLRWAMSDERLKEYTDRLVLENAYKRALSEAKKSKGKEFVSKALFTIGDKLVSAGADNLANNIRAKNAEKAAERKATFDMKIDEMKEKRKKERESKQITDWKDVLKNPEKHSDTEVGNAFTRLTRLNVMQKNANELSKSLSDQRKTEKGKTASSIIFVNSIKDNTTTRDWSRKTNPTIIDYKFLKESEERKKLYGPGGTAYR